MKRKKKENREAASFNRMIEYKRRMNACWGANCINERTNPHDMFCPLCRNTIETQQSKGNFQDEKTYKVAQLA